MKFFTILTLVIGLVTFASCTKDIGPNPDLVVVEANACDTVTFTKHIKPIIVANCAISGCHVSGFFMGDFATDTYAGINAKIPSGKFRGRVVDLTITPTMPYGMPPLAPAQIDLIKCWLEAGAPNN